MFSRYGFQPRDGLPQKLDAHLGRCLPEIGEPGIARLPGGDVSMHLLGAAKRKRAVGAGGADGLVNGEGVFRCVH